MAKNKTSKKGGNDMKDVTLYADIKTEDINKIQYNRIEFSQFINWAGVFPAARIADVKDLKAGQMFDGQPLDTATYFEDSTLAGKFEQGCAKEDKHKIVTNSYPITFDIEVNKCGTSWCQQFTINNTSIISHRWEDTLKIFGIIKNEMINVSNQYNVKCVASILDANLGYEFQFIRKRLEFTDVFATGSRNPLSCQTDHIYFRDPLRVSNSSLAKLSDLYNLPTKKAYKIINGKKVMDLDYNKPRTSKWVLTADEKEYCYNDVEILADFWRWCVKNYAYNNMPIPQTSTGMDRDTIKRLAKQELETVVPQLDKNGNPIKSKNGRTKTVRRLSKFAKVLPKLFPETLAEYDDLMEMTFVGGYTKSNFLLSGIELHNVNGSDFTSSYPASIFFGRYPMTPFYKIDPKGITLETIAERSYDMATIAKIKFKGLTASTTHSIQSISKTYEYKECGHRASTTINKYNMIVDNGRVYYADQMTVSLTDLDIKTFLEFYTWDSYEIISVQTAYKDFLPDYIRYAVIMYYQLKARLKKAGLDETTEYRIAKAMVNAFYGMMCEKIHIVQDHVDCTGGKDCWYKTAANVDREHLYKCQIYGIGGDPEDNDEYLRQSDMINKIESGKMLTRRYLSPYWAVYTTAISRRNLLENVYKTGKDEAGDLVIYCDTDSMYFIDDGTAREVVKNWNTEIYARNTEIVNDWNTRHGFDAAKYAAMTDDEKAAYIRETRCIDLDNVIDLGEFDMINKLGNYTRFKTLGSKRYIKEGPAKDRKTGKIISETVVTIAGLPKTALTDYAVEKGEDPFKLFENGMKIPKCKHGHEYIDEPFDVVVTDEQGNTEIMHEESAIIISDIDFSMKLSDMYRDLLYNIAPEVRINNTDVLDVIEKMKEMEKIA